MKIGYVRVSTIEQNEARQNSALNALGIEKIYTDKQSGKTSDRPRLKEMLSYIREGDTVVVESVSRIARNTKDFLNIVEQITTKGAEFISLKESIDTQTPTGKFMLTVFAALAELELETTAQRRNEGIAERKKEDAKRKAQGLKPLYYKGRQAIQIDDKAFRQACRAWRNGEQTATDTMKQLNLKPNTFYRRVKEMGV